MKFLSSKYFLAFLIGLSTLSIRFIHYNLIRYQSINKFLAEQYDWRALKLIGGETIHYPHAWGSFYVVLAGFYKVIDFAGFIADRITIMAVFQNILAAVSVGLLFLIAHRYFSTIIAICISLIFALYYPFIYSNMLLISETFTVFCLVIIFYLLLEKKLTSLKTIIVGVTLGFGLISRPMLLTFIPLLILWIFHYAKSKSVAILLALILSTASIVVTANYINFLYGQQKQFSFAGSGGVNFAMTNCHIKKISYQTQSGESFWFAPPAYRHTSTKEITTGIPFYFDQPYLSMGINCLRDNPVQLLSNFNNIRRIYFSLFYPNFHSSWLHNTLFIIWKWLSLVLTVFFFLFPFIRPFKDLPIALKKAYSLSVAFFLSLLIAVYLTNPGEERYLVTYFFVLPLFGLPALVTLLTVVTKLSLKRLKPR